MNKQILCLLILLIATYVSAFGCPTSSLECSNYCKTYVKVDGKVPTGGTCGGFAWLTCQCIYD